MKSDIIAHSDVYCIYCNVSHTPPKSSGFLLKSIPKPPHLVRLTKLEPILRSTKAVQTHGGTSSRLGKMHKGAVIPVNK